jgi:hypothetical protein
LKAYPSKHDLAVESDHLAPVSFEIKMAWLTFIIGWEKYHLSKVVAVPSRPGCRQILSPAGEYLALSNIAWSLLKPGPTKSSASWDDYCTAACQYEAPESHVLCREGVANDSTLLFCNSRQLG